MLFFAHVSVTSLVLALPALWINQNCSSLPLYSCNCIAVLQFQPMCYLLYSLLCRDRRVLFERLRVYSGYRTHACDLADFRS